MTQLLVLRERLRVFYQKYDYLLKPLFRLVIGYIAFSCVNRMVGYNEFLNKFYVELILAVVSIFLPGSVFLLLVAAFVVVHIFYVSSLLAVTVAAVFLVFYFGYARFVPDYAYIILLIPIAIPIYLAGGAPILLGLLVTPVAMIPMICGVVSFYLLQSVTSVISTSTDTGINLYHTVFAQFTACREMYMMIGIFVVGIVVVYVLRMSRLKYSFEIAIAAGTLINAILFPLISYALDVDLKIVPFLVGTLFTAALVWAFQFLRLSLNYADVEHLQFEDEEYYYYVRAVPKMNVSAPKKKVEQINPGQPAEKKTEDMTEEKTERRKIDG